MKQESSYVEQEFDMREFLNVVSRKIGILLVVGISFAITTFLISNYAIEWKYESTTQLYVLSKQDNMAEVTYEDLQKSTQLIKDYKILISSRIMTEQVITELDLDMEHEELIDLIRVENPSETRILNITVEYKNPYVAKQIADAVREFTTELIFGDTDFDQVSLMEEANLPLSPSTPNVKRNTVLAGTIGVVISTFIILIRYISDDTIKKSEDIEKYLNIMIIGTLPLPKSSYFQKLLVIWKKILYRVNKET